MIWEFMSLEMSSAEGKVSAGKQGCAIHKLLLPHRCTLMIHVKLMRDFIQLQVELRIFSLEPFSHAVSPAVDLISYLRS